MTRRLSSDEFLRSEEVPEGSILEGDDLVRAFWTCRGREIDLRRKEAFWEATTEALAKSYADLERTSQELREAREKLLRLNSELEARVEEQVREIVRHAQTAEGLYAELQARIQDRSRELELALRPLAEPDAVSALPTGEVFGGRVRVVKLLGQGGMGAVYLATDELTGRHVALKLMRSSLSGKAALQRFIGEARAASAVSHPAITRTIHIDVTDDGRLFQLMEYVPGLTLERRLATGPLANGATARLGSVIADALSSAHSSGVVHRDIKPSNIVLCDLPPGLRILDFGIAKVQDETGMRTALTLAGQIIGTPHYMSPEQIRDPTTAGPPSDVYSLGATLFEMLTGRPPFQHVGMQAIFLAHLSVSPPDPREIVPHVPEELARMVVDCLAKRASDRPEALDLAAKLAKVADDGSTPAAIDVARDELRVAAESFPHARTSSE